MIALTTAVMPMIATRSAVLAGTPGVLIQRLDGVDLRREVDSRR